MKEMVKIREGQEKRNKREKRNKLAKLEKVVPRYAWPYLGGALALNMLVYGGCRIAAEDRIHYDLSLPADGKVPLITPMAVPYLLAFAQWITGYVMIAREGEETCRRVMTGEMIAKLLSGACFLALPTTIERPPVGGNAPWDALTRMIYRLDKADNLFPSIHCLESWMVFRGSKDLRKVPALYRPLMLTFSLLVFASTVCLKQHVLVDIPGGMAAAEAGLYLSGILLRPRQ